MRPYRSNAIIDLYSGVGGLSLGAARAGFDVSSSVEIDKIASSAHAINFPSCKHIKRSTATLTGDEIKKLTQTKNFAGVIGGPPCQGFSTMGHRQKDDYRNCLFAHFFRLVSEIDPAFFIAENVPGILDDNFTSLRNMAFEKVEKRFRLLPPITIVASDFGAPTSRKRVFFIGYNANKIGPLSEHMFLPNSTYKPVFVQEALEGLPRRIFASWQSAEQGWRSIDRPMNDRFGIRLKAKIPEKVGDENAIRRLLKFNEVSGFLGTYHSAEVKKRFSIVKPGKTDPISRFPRLDPNGFCPTIRAGTDKKRGSFQAVRPIHPTQDRVITPREAARLQGFPDWFQFTSTKWHSFRQIGNSVSPIVAERVLGTIFKEWINDK